MVPANVYERTFQLWTRSGSGTCFAIDVDGRQYLATARHVVEAADPGELRITIEGGQVPLGSARVWLAPHADVAVIAIDRVLGPPNLPLRLQRDDMVFGQQAYFLGFPYGLQWHGVALHQGQPLPLVKGAIVAGEIKLDDGRVVLLLDAMNNPGFSGGPVVLFPPGSHASEVCAVGVVSGYQSESAPVLDAAGQAIGRALVNTGLMIVTPIEEALTGARALGDGVDLPA